MTDVMTATREQATDIVGCDSTRSALSHRIAHWEITLLTRNFIYARVPKPAPSQTMRTSAFAILSCPYDPSTTVVAIDPQHKNLKYRMSERTIESENGDSRSVEYSKKEEEVRFDHRSDRFGGVEVHSDRRNTSSSDLLVMCCRYESENSHMGIRNETIPKRS
jgi:hypothetical protein